MGKRRAVWGAVRNEVWRLAAVPILLWCELAERNMSAWVGWPPTEQARDAWTWLGTGMLVATVLPMLLWAVVLTAVLPSLPDR